ncbi:MAG: permease [Clostridia bacterium]|nr:permease [Clostridia bacterium]
MVLFGGILSIKTITFLTFSVFAIAAVGYLLGKITIKGVNLGTAGVFIIALVYGVFLYDPLAAQLKLGDASYVSSALKIVENIGLVLFVTAVGFIAGPNFFRNMKKNFKSYVLLGLLIILTSVVVTVAIIFIGGNATALDHEQFKAMVVGILSGALTSTPAFSAAKEAVGSADLEDLVAVGHGIAYLFGVVGVVLFVQIMPKIAKANMEEERKLITISAAEAKKSDGKKLVELDEFGFCAFSIAAILGIIIGSLNYKGFSLTTTGGCILAALIFGHFGKVGKISIMPKTSTLRVFRELGLMLFLIGAGVAGGASFVKYFQPIYFVYGILMTIIPMIIGYIFAKFVLKLPLLNNLGSITGGMTSTPALGTLIGTAGTEDVASAYAATYPIALITIVIASKLIIMFA